VSSSAKTQSKEFESCAPAGLNIGVCTTEAECPVANDYEWVDSTKCTEATTKCCQITAAKSEFDCGITDGGGGKCLTEAECTAVTVEKAPSSDAACADPVKSVCCLLTVGFDANEGFSANLILALNGNGAGAPTTAVADAATPAPVAATPGAEPTATLLQSRSRLNRIDRTKRNLKTLRSIRQKVKGCETPKCADGSDPVTGAGTPPSSNGCGPVGAADWVMKALDDPVLKPCCDDHDICYGTIGTPHENCDATFFSCMTARCKSAGLNWFLRFGCYEAATIYWGFVRALGCGPWQEAQKSAGCAGGAAAAGGAAPEVAQAAPAVPAEAAVPVTPEAAGF